MLAKLRSFALLGIDAVPVEVEVDSSGGLPKIILVGLPELAVRESIHRIERALANLGYARPTGRVIISLAPADLRKEGGAFDLPIALGTLVATRQLSPEQLADFASVSNLRNVSISPNTLAVSANVRGVCDSSGPCFAAST